MFESNELTKPRCEGCEYRKIVYAQNGFAFYGCYHHPYSGKWVEIIKECPKSKELSMEEELEQYKAIGTVEECRTAMERQTAKIPDTYGDGYDRDGNMIIDMYKCPGCGQTYEIECDHYKYCPECGQAIDRSNLI